MSRPVACLVYYLSAGALVVVAPVFWPAGLIVCLAVLLAALGGWQGWLWLFGFPFMLDYTKVDPVAREQLLWDEAVEWDALQKGTRKQSKQGKKSKRKVDDDYSRWLQYQETQSRAAEAAENEEPF